MTSIEMDNIVDEKTLEEWLNSDNIHLRQECLLRDYGLDTLVHDRDVAIRLKMAGLGKKFHDKNKYVRAEVAEQGYGLDVLINDEDAFVRATVAQQGYGLDILIKDKLERVRAAVAEQGYGLNFLIHDNSYIVRETAEATMKRKRRLSKYQK